MLLTMTVELLQSMVAKAVKGASCNKMIPLTSLMAIQCKENKLTLITTDATNYLYITEDKIDAEDFYVVVPVEQFSKLISKMTCTSVKLSMVFSTLLATDTIRWSSLSMKKVSLSNILTR